MADYMLGNEFYLYRNTGTYGSPTWVELENVRDVTPNFAKDEDDATSREFARLGWKAVVPTLRNCEVTFEMVYKPDDPDYLALRAAYLAVPAESIEFLILNGPVATAGNTGIRATFGVFNLSDPQPIAGVVKVQVTLKAVPADNPPAEFTVST